MSTDLNKVQTWMLAAITHAKGIGAGLATQARPRRIDEVILPSASLTAPQRLAIYNRSYHARLLSCFDHMFPALRHALGEDLFHEFALDYLHHHPPTSYTIDHLADAFPQHLAETRPDRELPAQLREGWCDFICELANLELEFLNVFDGPGLENQRLPDVNALLELEDDRLLALRPAPAPCLRLLTLRYPVHDYLVAVRRQEQPPLPLARESMVAMSRWNYRVVFHELTEIEHTVLSAIDGERQAADLPGEERDLPTLRAWLASWTAKGLLGTPD